MASVRASRWIGRWIFAVGLLHFIAGFFIYAEGWADVFNEGVIAAVDDYDHTATAFWFAAAGPMMMIVGGLVDHFEKAGDRPPSWLGWAMAALVAGLILPMPMTGAWFLVPPTIALLVRAHRRQLKLD